MKNFSQKFFKLKSELLLEDVISYKQKQYEFYKKNFYDSFSALNWAKKMMENGFDVKIKKVVYKKLPELPEIIEVSAYKSIEKNK